MRKTVFLKLPNPGAQFSWYELDEEGKQSGPFSATFTDITEHFPEHDVIVLAPAEDILLTHVDLPKISRSKMQQAVAYTLEEHLSDDVSKLHFSCGVREAGKALPVAVVNVELMGQWFNLCGGHSRNGTHLLGMIPENLLIPWEQNTWTVWIEEGPLLVRDGEQSGFAIDAESAADILQLKINSAQLKPEKLVVYCSGNEQARSIFNGIELPVEYIALEQNGLELMIAEYKKHNIINMLQGEFKPRREMFSAQLLASVTAGLVGIWFGVLLLGNGAKYLYLNHHANKLDQQVTTVYKELFPNATSVISPKKRVERLLSSMRTSQSKGAFLQIVENAGPIVQQQNGVVVQSLLYSDSKAQLQVDVKDFSLLDRFTKQLRSAGFNVDQSSATKAGDTIQAKIELRLKS